ncbi:MAG: hypothetical protein JNL28_11080 [Planctomycetes bacterium]|nr:hypothetical protein [Planctomycetota bacterium]
MDALALLCTLHADGPATLVRLRAAGSTTIEHVMEMDSETLGVLLRSSHVAAGRFQREARALGERLTVEASKTPTAVEGRPFETRSAPAPLPSVPQRPTSMDEVLAAWRDRDAQDAAQRATSASPSASSSAPSASAPPPAIPVAAIDGLNSETSLALARAGVRDLATLATCDPLQLARLSNLSYSKLVRLRALARREVPTGVSATILSSPALKLSPSERPAISLAPVLRPDRDFILEPQSNSESAGGPFA